MTIINMWTREYILNKANNKKQTDNFNREVLSMVVFKRKQIVILSLVLMIVVAGYLQYSYKQSSISASEKDSGKLGEAIYVDNNIGAIEENKAGENDAKDTKKDSNAEAVKASQQAEDFFATAKLDRTMTRSKDTEELKGITEDQNAAKESKNKAHEQMIKIVANSEKEMKIESLIKGKGFDDAIVLFGDDESIDIFVKAPKLTAAQITSIADGASRQAKVPMNKIIVKGVF
jgi:stage III sporulation protein AH